MPYINQSVRYPTGCESVSAVMLLQFLGCPVTVDEFIENDLEQKAFEERDGLLFGPDPWKYFCGSPYDEESFGCYAPVICEALNHYFSRTGNVQYEAVDETGTSMEELKKCDEVAYIRFASVYRKFEDVQAFMSELMNFLNTNKK